MNRLIPASHHLPALLDVLPRVIFVTWYVSFLSRLLSRLRIYPEWINLFPPFPPFLGVPLPPLGEWGPKGKCKKTALARHRSKLSEEENPHSSSEPGMQDHADNTKPDSLPNSNPEHQHTPHPPE